MINVSTIFSFIVRFVNILMRKHFIQQQQQVLQRFNFFFHRKMTKTKYFFKMKQRGRVAAWQRGSRAAGQRGSGATYQRSSVPPYHRTTVPPYHRTSGAGGSVTNSKNGICSNVKWKLIIKTLMPFDFILIMITVLILILLIIIITTILFEFICNCIIEYLIDDCCETTHRHSTIDVNLVIIVVKIENMIKLIWNQMVYGLKLNKMRIESKLKMKMNHNNCN